MNTMKHHHELTEGKGKCSVPMYSGGCPAGFCDADAFGERPDSPMIWHAPKGRYVRADNKYDGYVPGLACVAHGGPKCPGMEIEPGALTDAMVSTATARLAASKRPYIEGNRVDNKAELISLLNELEGWFVCDSQITGLQTSVEYVKRIQNARDFLQSQPDTAVSVCSVSDTECGDNPKNWCSQCPLHIQWITPMQSQEADHEAIAQAHMAGQAEAGIDPSYSNAQRYAECVSPASVQQEAEPVAEVIPSLVGIELAWCNPPGRNRPPVGTKLYTQPPKAKMDDEPILCETCQGNGEIVTDLDRYLNAHEGDVGDEAVAECPDCYDGYRAAPAKAQIPEWKLVPIEPTKEMIDSCRAKYLPSISLPVFVAAYKTMITAAPKPTEGA